MCGAGILRELAEIAQRVAPSMESKMYGIHKENKISSVCGAGILHELVEIALRVGPSMESKMYGIRKENYGFHVCAVLGFCVNSLKLHREWAPVWRAKCMELIRKIMVFKCVRCWDFARTL